MTEFKRVPVDEGDMLRASQEVDARIDAAKLGLPLEATETRIVMSPHVVLGVALSEVLGQNIFTGEAIPSAETSIAQEQ